MASELRSSLGFDVESQGFPVLGFQHQLYPQANSLSGRTQSLALERLTRNIAIRDVESLGSKPKTGIFKIKSQSAEPAYGRGVSGKGGRMSETETCPDCGTELCSHGVCENYCHDEVCGPCIDEASWHNVEAAEINALNRMAILVGGFPEDEEETERSVDPPEPSEHEKRS